MQEFDCLVLLEARLKKESFSPVSLLTMLS